MEIVIWLITNVTVNGCSIEVFHAWQCITYEGMLCICRAYNITTIITGYNCILGIKAALGDLQDRNIPSATVPCICYTKSRIVYRNIDIMKIFEHNVSCPDIAIITVQ